MKQFNCPKCGSDNCRTMFEITVVTSAQYLHNFPTQAYMSDETEVWGCDWSNAFVYCLDCKWQRLPLHTQDNVWKTMLDSSMTEMKFIRLRLTDLKKAVKERTEGLLMKNRLLQNRIEELEETIRLEKEGV